MEPRAAACGLLDQVTIPCHEPTLSFGKGLRELKDRGPVDPNSSFLHCG